MEATKNEAWRLMGLDFKLLCCRFSVGAAQSGLIKVFVKFFQPTKFFPLFHFWSLITFTFAALF
ncbi:hypothetical protein [Flavisolibacter ginsenosidimutans]|uniref:Uncharacterized protein n=1 Tax=Flavisolibacter ginsenosidimutans TaxID=661481 RepID=A0A5B8UGX4_9BACT|nr:hypothetical protein [Flavisolibacter ginsenosidimutans]QEC55874.1 hypothetical protein FSB75_08190 [Flavisolibacter ginsenosidimutans]